MVFVKILKEIFEIAGAFLIAFLAYRGLAFAAGTPIPIVSIASGSMLTALHPGDLAVVTGVHKIEPGVTGAVVSDMSLEGYDINVGDIIIYHSDCEPYIPEEDVIHRVVRIEDGKIITKGDNNKHEDPCPVDISQVKGKVVFAVPLLGWPRLALNYLIGA